MSSGRNPKDLRSMVEHSHDGVSTMEGNLSKLRSLSKEDKSEMGLLRSRIDEQSQLIMILKQRADEHLLKAKTLEKCNIELEAFRENAQHQLDQEFRKFNMLNDRFDDLASNHQELIKFKDEYKKQNEFLRQENARLIDENSRLFSDAINDRDNKIKELEKKISHSTEQFTHMEAKNKYLEQQLKQGEDQFKVSEQKLKNEIKTLLSKLQESEERLKGANAKLKSNAELQQNADVESQSQHAKLKKEKDELLELAMQRGKLIQEKQTENKILQKQIESMEKQVQDMEAKFEKEAAMVNANMQVRKLRQDYEIANHKYSEQSKEFEAYKKHTQNLLQKEKDLNAKLRHLVG
ncbi:unnamed protein product [Owenia fusiformis]|uniref:Uncharacterized protein n=1 Tax=Owenia fusiformis TaxID=6347 RepID=A0A8J1XSG4_OWEFU|nr:unnamed protein product [Owenia fusiformis]